MRVLIGYEYSGIVRDAFVSAGHFAVSCDILPSASPGDHIQGDFFKAFYSFCPQLLICHPPCTYLCRSQMWRCEIEPYRKLKQLIAFNDVLRILSLDCPMICVENPIGYLNNNFRPPDQIIYPYNFGDPYRKDICLWLKNLPPLICSHYNTKKKSVSNHVNGRMSQEQKSKIRSKFFPGVAAAMANQWGSL